jgi:hypothetical protein
MWRLDLRWRLARRIAPEPIIRDPYPDLMDGAFVTMRSPNGLVVNVRAETFRLKMKSTVPSLHFDPTDTAYHPTPRSTGRFAGTVMN